MKTFIITDTHLGHDKMVEYCGRPPDHSERILESLKAIPKGSTLIHLGDICIGKDAEWHLKLMEALDSVHKILIRGNHDHKSDQWYREHGWNEVYDVMEKEYCGRMIHFSHIPIPNCGMLNVHGHMHNNEHRMSEDMKSWYSEDTHKLLAIEYTDLKPVDLCDWLNKK